MDSIKEIFRYSSSTGDFIGISTDVSDEIHSLGLRKFRNIHDRIDFITVKKTDRCAKKDRRYRLSSDDAIYGSGNGSLRDILSMKKLFVDWIRRERPPFVAVMAYQDSNYRKRIKLYHRVLQEEGYILYHNENSHLGEMSLIYARLGMNIKYPSVSTWWM